MAESEQSNLLRRKLGRAAAPGARPELAVLRAAARAAHSTAGLRIEMLEAGETLCAGITDVVAAISDAMLVVACRAPDGAEGFIALSSEMAQSLIEKATTGKLSDRAPKPRSASSIDMLLCRDFLVRFMETWREITQDGPEQDWLAGYAPKPEAAEVALMEIQCRDVAYRQFTVALRLDDMRMASMSAVFPADRHAPMAEAEAHSAPPEPDWGALWQEAVMDSPAELDAVFARLDIPLHQVQNWRVGSVLEIPATAMERVALGRRGGAPVAHGRLGQLRGRRAVRLNALSREGAEVPRIEAEAMAEGAIPPRSDQPADAPDPGAPLDNMPDVNAIAPPEHSQEPG